MSNIAKALALRDLLAKEAREYKRIRDTYSHKDRDVLRKVYIEDTPLRHIQTEIERLKTELGITQGGP